MKYKINFLSDWHCGSGLSAGMDTDYLVIKDQDGFPYIPGKTIKGLVREAVEEMAKLSGNNEDNAINKAFGFFDKDDEIKAKKGACFFTNAELPLKLRETIKQENVQAFFFRTISSTKIDASGVANEHSLRKMQVTIPCELEGEILFVLEELEGENILVLEDKIINGLSFIKRLGQNRNRGLGRCIITVEPNN